MTQADKSGGDNSARQDRRCVMLLLALAIGLRVWIIPHTAVPARDGIGFMHYAWQLQHGALIEVLRINHHPPAYPLSILAIATPLQHLLGNGPGDILHLSAQLAGALAGILLVVPMYYLGRELFDRRIGFWAAVLFQCFPASARVLSDALSEPLFLLTSATALLLAVRALNRPAAWRFAFCGLCAGLAYLTRPEGALLVIALTLMLAGLGLRAAAQWSWRTAAAGMLSLWLGTAVLAVPYIAIIGHLTQKPTGREVFQIKGPPQKEARKPGGLNGGPLLAVWYPEDRPAGSSRPLVWCVGAVLSEVVKGFYCVGCLVLPFGLWWQRARFRKLPGTVLLLLVALLSLGLLVRVAMVVGYVSERHVLLLVLCGMYWVATAVGRIGDWLSEAMIGSGRRWGAVVLFLLLTVSSLPRTLQPLHGHRAGFRSAGCWLAENSSPTDIIIDPFGWAAHYAGRTYQDQTNVVMSANRYFVWDCSKNSYRRADIDEASVRVWRRGQPVYHWPVQVPLEKAAVIVYCLPGMQSHQ